METQDPGPGDERAVPKKRAQTSVLYVDLAKAEWRLWYSLRYQCAEGGEEQVLCESQEVLYEHLVRAAKQLADEFGLLVTASDSFLELFFSVPHKDSEAVEAWVNYYFSQVVRLTCLKGRLIPCDVVRVDTVVEDDAFRIRYEYDQETRKQVVKLMRERTADIEVRFT